MKIETFQVIAAPVLGMGGTAWTFHLLGWQAGLAIFIMAWGFSLELKAMIRIRDKRRADG